MPRCNRVLIARPGVAFALAAAAWCSAGCGALIGVDPGEVLDFDANPAPATLDDAGPSAPDRPALEEASAEPAGDASTAQARGEDAASATAPTSTSAPVIPDASSTPPATTTGSPAATAVPPAATAPPAAPEAGTTDASACKSGKGGNDGNDGNGGGPGGSNANGHGPGPGCT
ncbi:MAG TPA: hypothetical protein VH044_04665 [Polyangiaceae bacterium]|jgi:hypothetical protein|nr:hypothetical protein [Polyangiaceae bacterium]